MMMNDVSMHTCEYHSSLWRFLICSWFIFIVIAHAALAGESVERSERPAATMPLQQTTFQADAAGQVNPEGLLLLLGIHRRWTMGMDDTLGIPSSYVQAGMDIGTTPAYGRANVHVEWLPQIFAKLRLQYDAFRYYGRNSVLLSFQSADVRFGRSEVEAKEDTEEAGYGNRILICPTFYAKTGPFSVLGKKARQPKWQQKSKKRAYLRRRQALCVLKFPFLAFSKKSDSSGGCFGPLLHFTSYP